MSGKGELRVDLDNIDDDDENEEYILDVGGGTNIAASCPKSSSSLPQSPLTRSQHATNMKNLRRSVASDDTNTFCETTNPLTKRLIRAPIEYSTVEKLREAFAKYDKNQDGGIDIVELGAMLRDLGVTEGDSKLEIELIKRLDRDGDGGIGFDEFVKFYQSIERSVTTSTDAGFLAARLNRVSQVVVDEVDPGASDVYSITTTARSPKAKTEPLKMKGLLDLVRQSQKDEEKEEYITDKKKQARQRIHGLMYDLPCFAPDYYIRRWWDLLVLLIIVYTNVFPPIQAIFKLEPTAPTQVCDWIVTALMLLDVLMCMNTAVQEEDRAFHLVTNRRDILRIYARSGYLFVDTISGIPFDLFCYYLFGVGWAWRVFRSFRVIKVVKWKSLFRLADRGNMDPSVVQFYFWVSPITKMVTMLLLTMNWLVIGRMMIATFQLEEKDTNCPNEEFGMDKCSDSTFIRYLYSAWWCWALLTTQGLAKVETGLVYTYAAVVMMFSLLLQGHVVATMSALLVKADISEQNRDSMRETLAIMRQYGIPSSLQQEVLSFQYHSLQQNAAAGFAHILERLPLPMQKEVGLYVRVVLIAKVPMFESLSVDCKLELASCLEQTYCEPDCFIIEYGEKGNEMYFIMHGFADVIIPAQNEMGEPDPNISYGTVVATVKRGDFFGELALLNPEMTRNASIQALSYCDMFQLHTYDFAKLLKDYDELRERMQAEAVKRGINELTTGGKVKATRPSFLDPNDLANALGHGGEKVLHPPEAEPRRKSSTGSNSSAFAVPRKENSFGATQSFRRMRTAAQAAKRASLASDGVILTDTQRISPTHESPAENTQTLFETTRLDDSVFSYNDHNGPAIQQESGRPSCGSLHTEVAPSVAETEATHPGDEELTPQMLSQHSLRRKAAAGDGDTTEIAGRIGRVECKIDQLAMETRKITSTMQSLESHMAAIMMEITRSNTKRNPYGGLEVSAFKRVET